MVLYVKNVMKRGMTVKKAITRKLLGLLLGRTYCSECGNHTKLDKWEHTKESCDLMCEKCGNTDTWMWSFYP